MPFNVISNLNYVRLHDDCYSNTLNEVNKLLYDCDVSVDFWGKRQLVSIKGIEKPIVPIDLETVAIRTLKTGYGNPPIEDCDGGEYLSSADRNLKSKICTQLSKFYIDTDSLIDNLNPISYLFFLIRERFNPVTRFTDFIDAQRGIENFTVRQQVVKYNLNRTV